jgi:nicotinamide riboside kinase
MRIYFVGSHATGKTTLCRYVSRRFGLPMITEVARAVLAEMESSLDALRTDMELVAEYQDRVFGRQVAIEKMHPARSSAIARSTTWRTPPSTRPWSPT